MLAKSLIAFKSESQSKSGEKAHDQTSGNQNENSQVNKQKSASGKTSEYSTTKG